MYATNSENSWHFHRSRDPPFFLDLRARNPWIYGKDFSVPSQGSSGLTQKNTQKHQKLLRFYTFFWRWIIFNLAFLQISGAQHAFFRHPIGRFQGCVKLLRNITFSPFFPPKALDLQVSESDESPQMDAGLTPLFGSKQWKATRRCCWWTKSQVTQLRWPKSGIYTKSAYMPEAEGQSLARETRTSILMIQQTMEIKEIDIMDP